MLSKKKLTERKALLISLEWWRWLADNPDKDKGDWPDRRKYAADYAIGGRKFYAECVACEYGYQHDHTVKRRCRSRCVIKWSPAVGCMDVNSPYHLWRFERSPAKRQILAGEVVKCIEASLAALPKLKKEVVL